jgi:L-aminopeptidase/D-esterase-like protein
MKKSVVITASAALYVEVGAGTEAAEAFEFTTGIGTVSRKLPQYMTGGASATELGKHHTIGVNISNVGRTRLSRPRITTHATAPEPPI